MAMWTKAQCKVQWELFCLFIRIGLMTFGGGTSMLPILQRELADQRGWLTEEELMDYYAIGQCTPGIIALNVATFTGRKRGGDLGGVVATAGFILPSLCIIIALAGVITSVEHLKWVQNAFAGIRACICVQILNAVIRLAKKALVDIWTVGIFVLVFVLGVFADVSPVWFVLASAAAGLVIQALEMRTGAK